MYREEALKGWAKINHQRKKNYQGTTIGTNRLKRNRFKGLDLTECLMNYGQRFMAFYRRQGSRPSPIKRNAKKQNGCLRRPYK